MARVKYDSEEPHDVATAKQMWMIKMILWTAYMAVEASPAELVRLDQRIVDVPILKLRRRFSRNGRPFPWVNSEFSPEELVDHLSGVIEAAILFED